MGRIMAIDYGQKRAGLAVSDENRIIATALETVHTKDIFAFLKNYVTIEKVDCFVIGEPRQMNNQLSESVKFIDPFVRKMKKIFPEIRIERYDERFTSKIAMQTLAKSGLKKKERQNKSNIDKISAVLILQSFMEFKQRSNELRS
jgi:putative holliday junction resolvase